MSLSSTRTFDLAQMSSQVQHFNVKTITNIDRLMKVNFQTMNSAAVPILLYKIRDIEIELSPS